MIQPSVYSQTSIIAQAGRIAHRCLLAGQRGKVFAALSKAIYFLTNDDELFWITTKEAPMHSRCAQISSALPTTLARCSFRVEEHRLILDSGFICTVNNPKLWSVSKIDPNLALPVHELPKQIDSLFSNLDLSQVKGFGKFIPLIRSLAQKELFSSEFSDPILHFAQPYILRTVSACLDHQFSQILERANVLIGLGPGLTPSGDDFVGGMLFAIKMITSTYARFIDFVIPIETYRLRTHRISFTLLKDLAYGHGVAPLHQIMNTILGGEPIASTYPFISELTQLGHSTGWDLLAGLLTGLLVTYEINNTISSLPLHHSLAA